MQFPAKKKAIFSILPSFLPKYASAIFLYLLIKFQA